MFVTCYLDGNGAQDLTAAVDRTKTLIKLQVLGNVGSNTIMVKLSSFIALP